MDSEESLPKGIFDHKYKKMPNAIAQLIKKLTMVSIVEW